MLDKETKIALEAANIEIDRIKQILVQKGSEKGTKALLEAINKSFIKNLNLSVGSLQEVIKALKEIGEKSGIDRIEILEAIKSIKLEPKIEIKIPEIKSPEIKIPEIKIPNIKVPQPIVQVSPPEVNVNPDIKMPKEMKVTGLKELIKRIVETFTKSKIEKVDRDHPLEVVLVDKKGKYYIPVGGAPVMMGGQGGGPPIAATKGGHGSLEVATPGSPEQLPDMGCKRVYIQANEDNTGRIAIGFSDTVRAALAARNARYFYKTWGDWFNVSNLNLLWIDAVVSGEGITYSYEK